MPGEPITLFTYRLHHATALAAVRAVAPDVKVEGPPNAWSSLRLTVRRGLLRRAQSLELHYDPEYEAEPNWTTQMRGMTGYLSRWPRMDKTGDVLSLITALKHSIGVIADPDIDLDGDRDDLRVKAIRAVARSLDAILFSPSTIRDFNGRVIVSVYGNDGDPQAVVPNVPAVGRSPETGNVTVRMPADVAYRMSGPNTDEDADDEAEIPPPTPERVVARALALAAVTGRALLEQEDPSDPGVEETRQRILKWIDEIGIGEELEPDEWQILQQPIGTPDQQSALNSTWRLEGLGILAWALNRFDLRPIDALVDPGKLLPAVGILNADRAKALLAEPPLRSVEELLALRNQSFALHWRMVNYRLKPEEMDFAEFAKTAWFGPLDISDIRLIDGDLALGDAPIARADRQAVGAASSAAMERHLAINWLCGGSNLYSETDVST